MLHLAINCEQKKKCRGVSVIQAFFYYGTFLLFDTLKREFDVLIAFYKIVFDEA